jgi:hypothetical protein
MPALNIDISTTNGSDYKKSLTALPLRERAGVRGRISLILFFFSLPLRERAGRFFLPLPLRERAGRFFLPLPSRERAGVRG